MLVSQLGVVLPCIIYNSRYETSRCFHDTSQNYACFKFEKFLRKCANSMKGSIIRQEGLMNAYRLSGSKAGRRGAKMALRAESEVKLAGKSLTNFYSARSGTNGTKTAA